MAMDNLTSKLLTKSDHPFYERKFHFLYMYRYLIILIFLHGYTTLRAHKMNGLDYNNKHRGSHNGGGGKVDFSAGGVKNLFSQADNTTSTCSFGKKQYAITDT